MLYKTLPDFFRKNVKPVDIFTYILQKSNSLFEGSQNKSNKILKAKLAANE